MNTRQADSLIVVLVGAGLAVLTLLVYCPSFDYPFVNFDDPAYVSNNPQVHAGLTPDSIRWAFTSFACVNWHPLTWLSLQLDAQLWGAEEARAFHRTNVLLHTANTVLLFWVFCRMTGLVWRSAAVAALFALHPLHVESVAWVTERKDVLSTLFWMLTLAAYLYYVRRAGVGRYLLVMLMLELGLMAKPMLVTLPLILLLFDYWPLSRLGPIGFRRLVIEKGPLCTLVLASCLLTFLAQRRGQAVAGFEIIPLQARIENALLAYVAYVGQMFWPLDLAVYYPHPGADVSALQAVGAGLILLLVTGLVLGPGRRWRYLMVGWLWYLVTLVPVIGLVQVGEQAMADRYTYVPLIGLFLLLTWGISDLAVAWRLPRLLLAGMSAAVLSGCVVLTWVQLTYWRESVPLWQHTIAATQKNALAHYSLARVLNDQSLVYEAEAHYKKAIEYDPKFVGACFELGSLLQNQGRLEEAHIQYQRASELDPSFAPYHAKLAAVLTGLGRPEEAVAECRKVVALEPTSVQGYQNLVKALEDVGWLPEALRACREAIALDPRAAALHNHLGGLLYETGRPEEAMQAFQEAIHLESDYADAHFHLGQVLLREGRFAEALDSLARAHELGSRNPRWSLPSAQWVAQAQRLIALDSKLPSILKGEAQPADNGERLVLALLCRCKHHYAAAARFYAAAFDEDPRVGDDPRTGHGYEAACAAALAGCGRREAGPNAADAEDTRLRRQAHAWLQADLKRWTKLAHTGRAKDNALVYQSLRRWQTGPDLAGVRDRDALAKLPTDELAEWTTLWRKIQTVVAEARLGSYERRSSGIGGPSAF
jgi:tetratricopeptide (TPR) repeat protein